VVDPFLDGVVVAVVKKAGLDCLAIVRQRKPKYTISLLLQRIDVEAPQRDDIRWNTLFSVVINV
jgi:hypothetical protein